MVHVLHVTLDRLKALLDALRQTDAQGTYGRALLGALEEVLQNYLEDLQA